MTRKRGSVSHTSETFSVWRTVLVEVVKFIVIGIVASIGSILVYLLTPFNELINTFIWKEKAEILLISQNSSLQQGEVLNLDVFIQQQSSPVATSEGTLIIDYSKDILRPGAESMSGLTFTTPKLSGSKKLTEKSLDFIADAVGKGEISAQLNTKNGSIFSAKIPVEVFPRNDQGFPTHRNFSGSWNIDLGRIHGTMVLKERARTLAGEYRLSDGRRGQVEGTRDGKTFRITFYMGTAPSRWFIEGTFDPNPQTDLEIQGKAWLMLPAPDQASQWKSVEDTGFHAVAAAR
jgi:hypothetical protein